MTFTPERDQDQDREEARLNWTSPPYSKKEGESITPIREEMFGGSPSLIAFDEEEKVTYQEEDLWKGEQLNALLEREEIGEEFVLIPIPKR